MKKVFPISLKPNFTPSTFGGYGLITDFNLNSLEFLRFTFSTCGVLLWFNMS